MPIQQTTIDNATDFGRYMLVNNLSVLKAIRLEHRLRPSCAHISDRTGFNYMNILRDHRPDLHNALVRARCLKG